MDDREIAAIATDLTSHPPGRGPAWAEVFLQSGVESTAELRDGELTVRSRPDLGVAIRAERRSTTTFVHTNSLSRAAVADVLSHAGLSVPGWLPAAARAGRDGDDPAEDQYAAELHCWETETLRLGRVIAATVQDTAGELGVPTRMSFSRSLRVFRIASSEGVRASGRSQLSLVQVKIGRPSTGSAKLAVSGGNSPGEADVVRMVTAAATEAVERAAARPPVSGTCPVVFAPSEAGLLVHEVIAHPLEADAAFAGSLLWRSRGTPFSSGGLQVTDEPSHPDAWDPAQVDDEGTPCGRTVLVQDGCVTGVVSDRNSAARHGLSSSGHARRASFAAPPVPRVRHTTVAPGPDDALDMIRGTADGILVEKVIAADADPPRGSFTMRVGRARKIRAGALTEPLADFTVRGHLTDFGLLDAIGQDRAVEQAICGKAGRWTAISFSTPALRFARLSVHGRPGP